VNREQQLLEIGTALLARAGFGLVVIGWLIWLTLRVAELEKKS
jgi:hypothetical protein